MTRSVKRLLERLRLLLDYLAPVGVTWKKLENFVLLLALPSTEMTTIDVEAATRFT